MKKYKSYKLAKLIFIFLGYLNTNAFAQLNQCQIEEYEYNFKLCVIENSIDGGNNLNGIPFYFWLRNPISTVKFRNVKVLADASFKAEVNWKNQYNGFTDWLPASGFKEKEFPGYFCCGLLKINVGEKYFTCDTRHFNRYTPTGVSICSPAASREPLPPLSKSRKQ